MENKLLNPMELKRKQRSAKAQRSRLKTNQSGDSITSTNSSFGSSLTASSVSRVRKRPHPSNPEHQRQNHSIAGTLFRRTKVPVTQPPVSTLGNSHSNLARKAFKIRDVTTSRSGELEGSRLQTNDDALSQIDSGSNSKFMSFLCSLNPRSQSANSRLDVPPVNADSRSQATSTRMGFGWSTVRSPSDLPTDYSLKTTARVFLPQALHSEQTPQQDERKLRDCHLERARSLCVQVSAAGSSIPATQRQHGCVASAFREATVRYIYPAKQLPDALHKHISQPSKATLERNRIHTQYGYGGKKLEEDETNTRASKRDTLLDTAFVTSEGSLPSAVDMSKFALDEQCEWAKAFMSLYHILQEGLCQHFYYVEETLTKESFAVLFLAPGTLDHSKKSRGESPACAFISSSRLGLRRQLEQKGIDFGTPLDPQLKARDSGSKIELLHELRQFEEDASRANISTTCKPTGRNQDEALTKSSLLSFVGQKDVHKLYNFLLNRVVDRCSYSRVPTLLASAPFENATISCASVSQPISSTQSQAGARIKQESLLRVDGMMLPRSIYSFGEVISARSSVKLKHSVRFQSHPLTVDFNEGVEAVRKQLIESNPQSNERFFDAESPLSLKQGSIEEIGYTGEGEDIFFRVRSG